MASIADKISKLLAHANSTTNEKEADAFLTKAYDVMLEHGVTLMDLGKLSEDPVNISRNVYSGSSSYPWLRRVAYNLADYYGCTCITSKYGTTTKFAVIGRESARITFSLMLPFVKDQIMRIGREAYKRGEYNSNMVAVSKVGAATALRIARLIPPTLVHHGNGVNALVPVDIMENMEKELFPDLKLEKRKLTTDLNAVRLAEQVKLERQVQNSPDIKLLAQ